MKEKGFAPVLIIILIATLIGGYLIYSGKINLNSSQPINTRSIQSSPSATIKDETANWKTYSADSGIFEFKHPSNWYISREKGKDTSSGGSGEASFLQGWSVTNFPTDPSSPSIYLQDNGIEMNFDISGITPNFNLDNIVPCSPAGGFTTISCASEVANGISYKKYVGQTTFSTKVPYILVTISTIKNDKAYTLHAFVAQGNDQAKNLNIVNQIISTFKFLDQNQADVSNWKTYTNTKYGFEIKHPIDAAIDDIPNPTKPLLWIFLPKQSDKDVGSQLSIDIVDNPKLKSVKDFCLSRWDSKYSIIEEKQIRIGDIIAHTVRLNTHFSPNISTTCIAKENKIIVLDFNIDSIQNDPLVKEHTQTLNLIISTFKFTN